MGNPREIHGDIGKDLQLKESEVAVVHGQISGDVFVKGSSTLILHGIVRGNVWVEDQGTAFIHGMVSGNVTNDGGRVKHYGMIKGKLNKLAGETVVNPRSLICEDRC